MKVEFMSYIQRDFYMKVERYVSGKTQDYDTAIPCPEKHQRDAS